MNKYLSLTSLLSRLIILNEIRLAIDAMRVPNPPIVIPTIMSLKLLLKPVSNMAAGTLEMTCDMITPHNISFPIIILLNNSLKNEIFSKLPIRIKSAMNVRSK